MVEKKSLKLWKGKIQVISMFIVRSTEKSRIEPKDFNNAVSLSYCDEYIYIVKKIDDSDENEVIFARANEENRRAFRKHYFGEKIK